MNLFNMNEEAKDELNKLKAWLMSGSLIKESIIAALIFIVIIMN